jgi:hypothetical protein
MQRALFRAELAASLLLVCSQTAETAPILIGGIGFGSQSNRGRVATINQSTGAGALLSGQAAGPDAGINGLTFDPTGALYASSINNTIFEDQTTIGDPTLVKLDPATGDFLSGVPITFGTDSLEVLDLAAQPGTGLLFGLSFTSENPPGSSLYIIDKDSGEATLLGATNVIGVALAFGPNGVLYMTSATFDAQGQTGSFLHTVNPTNGGINTTDPIAPMPSGNLLHVGGLAVRPDGLLLAAAREANVNRRGDIYTLTTSGAATFVGSTGVGDVGDVAFAPIPEPGALLLLSSGLAGIGVVAVRRRRTSPRR